MLFRSGPRAVVALLPRLPHPYTGRLGRALFERGDRVCGGAEKTQAGCGVACKKGGNPNREFACHPPRPVLQFSCLTSAYAPQTVAVGALEPGGAWLAAALTPPNNQEAVFAVSTLQRPAR